jgi:hypothetical protein
MSGRFTTLILTPPFKKKMWLVEIIRHGNPELGVYIYGVFDDYERIHSTMTEYNQFRGGKYPAYYVTPIGVVNPEVDEVGSRKLYEI